MVCSYTLAIAHLLELQGVINKPLATASQLASICAKSERFIGVESGGMDQAISFLAEKEFAMRIDFQPTLKATKVQLSPEVTFVLCNSLVEHKLQSAASGAGYNVRVVECRLAAAVLAAHTGMDNPTSIRTLLAFEQAYQPTNEDAVSRLEFCEQAVREKLHPESYNVEEIKSLLGATETFEKDFLGTVTSAEILGSLKLFERALHVFSEAKRVLLFQRECELLAKGESTSTALGYLGELMNSSHESCRDLFECSCPQLDEITSFCRSQGALGSRLTGAGWGGWCISMVPTNQIPTFLSNLSSFYSTRSSLPADRLFFPTAPSSGACVLRK